MFDQGSTAGDPAELSAAVERLGGRGAVELAWQHSDALPALRIAVAYQILCGDRAESSGRTAGADDDRAEPGGDTLER